MCGHSPCSSPDCTWSEKHRFECEARAVMTWDRERRSRHYAAVRKTRGEEYASRLVAEVKKQWKAKNDKG